MATDTLPQSTGCYVKDNKDGPENIAGTETPGAKPGENKTAPNSPKNDHMALFWRTERLPVAIGSTHGTDPLPPAVNGALVNDVIIQPMLANDDDQDLELPSLGGMETIPVNLGGMLSVIGELAPSEVSDRDVPVKDQSGNENGLAKKLGAKAVSETGKRSASVLRAVPLFQDIDMIHRDVLGANRPADAAGFAVYDGKIRIDEMTPPSCFARLCAITQHSNSKPAFEDAFSHPFERTTRC